MNEKLHRFILAGLTNPRHPVFQFRATNPILQHYAVNVQGAGMLETISPEQWEQDYPRERDTMLEVMRLCEAEQTEAAAPPPADPAKAELERKLAEAQDQLTAKDAEIAQLRAAAEPPAE